MILTLGISELAAWVGEDNHVTPSIMRFFSSAFHQDVEMREEVDADERLCDVGHQESPREVLA
jgi:hypothetical protein